MWRGKCKYNDCLHFNEPYVSCSVDRYGSYLRIISAILNAKAYSDILREGVPNDETRCNMNLVSMSKKRGSCHNS